MNDLIQNPCLLDKLIEYYLEYYFREKLYEVLEERIRSYKELLSCDSIENLSLDEFVKKLADLWTQYGYKGYSRSNRQERIRSIKDNLSKEWSEYLLKLKKFVCEEKKEASYETLKNLSFKNFGFGSASELATILFPEVFFIYNNPARNALKLLMKKGIIKEIDLPPPSYSGKLKKSYGTVKKLMTNLLCLMKKHFPHANFLDLDSFLYVIYRPKSMLKNEEILNEWFKRAEQECYHQIDSIGDFLNILREAKQVILYGVPGAGKTYTAIRLAKAFASGESRVVFVSFHSSYTYEEFVEGIKPYESRRGTPSFKIQPGLFKRLVAIASCDLILRVLELSNLATSIELSCCDKLMEKVSESSRSIIDSELIDKSLIEVYNASKSIRSKISIDAIRELLDCAPRYVLVIDEINRGDIARILGELITLLDGDKRLFMENETVVSLSYSKTPFFIPPNLYIIGTMNSTDRSIAFVDFALRRRFAFIELQPDINKVPEVIDDFNLRNFFEKLNEYIEAMIDRDHRIGHSYFMNIRTLDDLRKVWFLQIRPLLIEYFYGRDRDISEKLGDLYTKSIIGKVDEFKERLKHALDKLSK